MITRTNPMYSRPGSRRRLRAQSGVSLLEVLLASLLLLVVSVFVLPMFSNALTSTVAGGRASELSTLTQHSLEVFGQRTVAHEDWDLPNGVTCSGDPCWQENNPDHWYWAGPGVATLGDEGWEGTTGSADFHWKRTLTIRKYSIADVAPGTLGVDQTTLDILGHPNLFDEPLATDDAAKAFDAHFLEFRVLIEPDNDRILFNGEQQQQITVSQFRAN